MASFTFTGSNGCSGGEHFTLTVSGDMTGQRRVDFEDIRQADGMDLSLAFRLLHVHFTGMTKAQMRQALAAGVTITV